MPTFSRKASRSVISRTISRAIARSVSFISSAAIHSAAARAERSLYSAMLMPPTLTARLSGRSRAPSHSGHGCSAM